MPSNLTEKFQQSWNRKGKEMKRISFLRYHFILRSCGSRAAELIHCIDIDIYSYTYMVLVYKFNSNPVKV